MIPSREIDLLERTTAVFKIAFEKVWSTWPFGQCGITCLVLAPILRTVTNSNVKVHVGYVRFNGQDHRHVWLMVAGYYLIDPTYEQFSNLNTFNGHPKEAAQIAPLDYRENTYLSHLIMEPSQEDAYRNSIVPCIVNGENWASSGVKDFWNKIEGLEEEE